MSSRSCNVACLENQCEFFRQFYGARKLGIDWYIPDLNIIIDRCTHPKVSPKEIRKDMLPGVNITELKECPNQ